jgi:IS1 family transposase
MDELYALLSEMREEGEKRGQCWVWAAIDPISKLLLAIEAGDRSLETLVPALQVQVWHSGWCTEW